MVTFFKILVQAKQISSSAIESIKQHSNSVRVSSSIYFTVLFILPGHSIVNFFKPGKKTSEPQKNCKIEFLFGTHREFLM